MGFGSLDLSYVEQLIEPQRRLFKRDPFSAMPTIGGDNFQSLC